MVRERVTIDGNEAAAYVAYKTNEVIAIYPITPSSPMGELADEWSAHGQTNIWGTRPQVVEMQSEGGAAGAVHGALQTGSLTTTFTASQGLLLMIPNLYKIAGELTSTVFHIAARSVAAQALSIFGDHSDVMAARSTGWAMLFSNSVQEVMDLALIAQASTLKARVPFLHIFDGFRTSHEINKIEKLSDDDIRSLIDDELVRAHRARGLSPDRPFIRGTAQNPDVFFQARETVNPFYLATPQIVQETMDQFARLTGRHYHLFDYVGAPDAERVIVLMGSGVGAVEETVEHLMRQGEKVGVVKVRLFRPFSGAHLLQALPPTVRRIAVLDRTKEPGSAGEPLYVDVVTAVAEGMASGEAPFTAMPRIVGGRYGLSSKEFTPAMVKGIFDELDKERPKNHFTVGIVDDVTHTSIDYDPNFDIEPDDVVRAVFWGLGSDGTVSANKNSIKIIGEETPNYAQGYFVYDSKKSGARTVSHLRFGPRPIRSTYLIRRANFVAVHQFGFLQKFNVLEPAAPGATFLLNAPFGPDEVWDQLPRPVQEQIIQKRLKFYVIDAYKVAAELGLGVRINTIMQTCFFAISGVLPREEAIAQIKQAIRKTYGKRGEVIVRKNFAAVDAALAHLHQVSVPDRATSTIEMPPVVPEEAPQFVKTVTAPMLAGEGDLLPVSALPVDGTYPSATTRWEKRNIALEVPVWDPDICIQCGKCVLVCPHAVIRSKVVDESELANAPEGFLSADARWRELAGKKYTLQVAVEDCTGCSLCVEVCPAKDKRAVGRKAINMEPQLPLREQGRRHWDFFLQLPEQPHVDTLRFNNVKNVQLLQPLFEFSGACAGCGETPYLKLMSQLFGDRTIIANATGCSSIYGGNLPTTPWAVNREGRGPAWSNSLFEDNAEFGLGMRLTLDKQAEYAAELVQRLRHVIGDELADGLLQSEQADEAEIQAQRARVEVLKQKLTGLTDGPLAAEARDLLSLADKLVRKSVWIVGGDGWAYDIGYGGLDHVLASGRNVNILVLDTEVYSNTGGQSSKATPLGAVAKFAAGGKATAKKDLGLMAMSYGNVYVAQVAMGANDAHTVRAFLEAESYPGPSLIIAYSHCIAHGINMAKGMEQQRLATESGYWPLYRYDPRRKAEGKNPLQLDSKAPRIPLKDYAYNENRYRMLTQTDPEAAERLLQAAQEAVWERWRRYEELARSPVAAEAPASA
ncbi:pyruvate:ferredoxin (flavodoxin) oxidoreductase [Litorilinea aerophila]|uniref:Pyruvate:ferredoxin (Flavodoxin) oxidoreductase n=1 Tax=Litorilinea aerophila TaxID=1204385 RepID=A0A540VDB8_9CHLR|nr:pyruvate:ferredoxin (flavodoxin) oxidoreductase [Litorilinea aerophila]MCC9077435.1 pyruvate:ferredoxin (flavodoxin) oxidoreductase [Litorilinea aerophila]GIV77592.1 MAG: pyruvate-flavodoxin oxidoreductase [Litorilinea sp.]